MANYGRRFIKGNPCRPSKGNFHGWVVIEVLYLTKAFGVFIVTGDSVALFYPANGAARSSGPRHGRKSFARLDNMSPLNYRL